jgi:mitochondrial ornithine carrier protein
MAENAILFFAYGELQNLIRRLSNAPLAENLSLSQLAFAAAGAGAITSFFLCVTLFRIRCLSGCAHVCTNRTPIELVKCKMQVQMLVPPRTSSAKAIPAAGISPTLASLPPQRNLPGPLAILRDAIRADGVRGLWLGQTGTLIRETGGSAAWFGTKELICKLLRRDAPTRELWAWESALSGACAGAAYNLAFFPADTIKSTMQTEAELRPASAGTTGQRSFATVARELYRARGLRGLYAGCGITVARSVPSSAMIFLIYDGLKTRFA